MLDETKPYGLYVDKNSGSCIGQDGKLFDGKTKEFIRDLNPLKEDMEVKTNDHSAITDGNPT